jgi:hypothetical protein
MDERRVRLGQRRVRLGERDGGYCLDLVGRRNFELNAALLS